MKKPPEPRGRGVITIRGATGRTLSISEKLYRLMEPKTLIAAIDAVFNFKKEGK